MVWYTTMFGGIHGTSIVMLGVDQGVLVGADKRAGDTLSSAFTDDAPKILPIHPSGLATGWGMASLKDLKTGLPCADIFKMMRRICRYPQFQFRPDDFGRVGVTWQQMMRDLLSGCPPRDWPPRPDAAYWFRAMFVFHKARRVEAWILELNYAPSYPEPMLTGGFDSVKDEYVNGGHLLIEGDQRGGELLIEESPARPFLRETHEAWTTGLNPAEITLEKGARIVKDALYACHLNSTKADGHQGVGPTCDIAFIDRQVGFRWYEQNISTLPPILSEGVQIKRN